MPKLFDEFDLDLRKIHKMNTLGDSGGDSVANCSGWWSGYRIRSLPNTNINSKLYRRMFNKWLFRDTGVL